jgi:hypothetical protein
MKRFILWLLFTAAKPASDGTTVLGRITFRPFHRTSLYRNVLAS